MSEEVRIIPFTGRIDAGSAPHVETCLNRAIDEGSRSIVVNLSGVDYMSSAGLRVLLAAQKRLKPLNGELRLVCLTPFVREVFDLTGFSRLFRIFNQETEAVASFST